MIYNNSGGSGVNVLGPPGPGDDDSSLFGRIRAGAAAADALVNTSSAVSRTVTIYRNGFTVDNGPLRDPTAPENASFLSDLTRGRVPRGNFAVYSFSFNFVIILSFISCRAGERSWWR